jgi:hypothetical protein
MSVFYAQQHSALDHNLIREFLRRTMQWVGFPKLCTHVEISLVLNDLKCSCCLLYLYLSLLGRSIHNRSINDGQSRDSGNIAHTRYRTKTNKTQKHNTTQTNKKMSNTYPTTNREWTEAKANGKQFLPLIIHPQCYSYSQDVFVNTMRKQTQITFLRHEPPVKT